MRPITAQVAVDAPPDVVWDTLTDIDNSPAVFSSMTAIERITPSKDNGLNDDGTVKKFDVGTRWKETRVLRGLKETAEMYVTSMDGATDEFYDEKNNREPFVKSYTVESDAHGAHYRSILRVESARKVLDDDANDGKQACSPNGTVRNKTILTMEFEVEPANIVNRALMAVTEPLMRDSTKKLLSKDLREIAVAAEKKSKDVNESF